jgi:hypothetical protein
MKNLRYLLHNFRARIEHFLVLTRIGQLTLRVLNLLVRGTLFNIDPAVTAVYVEGLKSTLSSGFDIDLSVPAVLIQNVGDGITTPDVSFVTDENLLNGGTAFQQTISTPDPLLDRIDIIEGQIKTRNEFTDTAVDVVDPITKVVTPTTLERDVEIYLLLNVKTGTPAADPVPPALTGATAGFLLGTVTTDVLDLSTQYLINMTIGSDGEFVEVDLRGAIPTSTTRAERIAAINAAGFGTIATNVGGAIKITALGVGENSVFKIKSPLQASKDAYTLVFGNSVTLGYLDIYTGENAKFKIAEVFVPQGAATLVPGNVRSREDKDTLWDADADSVENSFSFDGHRKSKPLDHVDESIEVRHLDPSVLGTLQQKTTLYRNAGTPIYLIEGDVTFRQGSLFYKEDINIVQVNGDTQDAIEIEQEFPVHRVDQRQEDFTGPGYAVPISLSELTTDKHFFTVGALINDGISYYMVKEFETNHARVGIYITNGGSVSGFTHLRITLHNSADATLGFVDIPIADLQTVGTGWIYANLLATLVNGLTYHYHFNLVGTNGVTTAVLGTDALNNLTCREMYLPTSGKYGSASAEDVVNILDKNGTDLISVRSLGDDDIISPGDGFIGVSGLDLMVEDFSDTSYWENWNYQDYVGIDMTKGRIKLPTGEKVQFLYAEFNVREGINESDAKNFLRHTSNESIDTSLVNIEESFIDKEITELNPDKTTNIYSDFVGVSSAVIFPEILTPRGSFDFVTRSPGQFHIKPITFLMLYAMDSSDTGIVKIDYEIYVEGSLLATRSIIIDPPDDTSRAKIETTTSDIYIEGNEFENKDSIYINISRDNGVGSNHTGKFQLIGLTVKGVVK